MATTSNTISNVDPAALQQYQQQLQQYSPQGLGNAMGLGNATWSTSNWSSPSTVVPVDVNHLTVAGITFDAEDMKILRKIVDSLKKVRQESGEADLDQAVEEAVAALRE